jgi:hypothetical protein
MKIFEIQKIETYWVQAENQDKALEFLGGLDNSSAYSVETRIETVLQANSEGIYANVQIEK